MTWLGLKRKNISHWQSHASSLSSLVWNHSSLGESAEACRASKKAELLCAYFFVCNRFHHLAYPWKKTVPAQTQTTDRNDLGLIWPNLGLHPLCCSSNSRFVKGMKVVLRGHRWMVRNQKSSIWVRLEASFSAFLCLSNIAPLVGTGTVISKRTLRSPSGPHQTLFRKPWTRRDQRTVWNCQSVQWRRIRTQSRSHPWAARRAGRPGPCGAFPAGSRSPRCWQTRGLQGHTPPSEVRTQEATLAADPSAGAQQWNVTQSMYSNTCAISASGRYIFHFLLIHMNWMTSVYSLFADIVFCKVTYKLLGVYYAVKMINFTGSGVQLRHALHHFV